MRKNLILTAICIFMAMNVPAWAQTDKAAGSAPSGHESHAGHAGPDAAKPAPPPPAVIGPQGHDHGAGTQGHDHGAGMGKNVQAMDMQLKKMRAQLERVKATTDPVERQKLMQEYIASMREGMKLMQEAPGSRMMAGGMKGGEAGKMEMKPMGKGPMPMMMHHQTMEKKMEMMQVMMEGLIEALPVQVKP